MKRKNYFAVEEVAKILKRKTPTPQLTFQPFFRSRDCQNIVLVFFQNKALYAICRGDICKVDCGK